MVICMDRSKVTLSIPRHTLGPAREAAKESGISFSAYVTRALRNETLRQQLAAAPLPELTTWLDDAEADDEAHGAGAA